MGTSTGWTIFLGLFLALTGAGSATAQSAMRAVALPAPSTNAPLMGETHAPLGYVDFCKRYLGECDAASVRPVDVSLTAQSWQKLIEINAKVNEAITPVTDMEHWGVIEKWDYPTDGKGDCEDYVLLKRKLLMEAGFPRQALLITVVRDKKNDGHAVLTVKTDRGEYVLDNQEEKILAWTETGYRFSKRQMQEYPNRWVSIGDGSALFTSSR